MASFQERFKNKISTIGRQGELDVNSRFMIEKKSPIRTSVNAILGNSGRKGVSPHTVSPIVEIEAATPHKPQFSTSQP